MNGVSETAATSGHFADRLMAGCRAKAPICIGLDPVYERLPGPLGAGPAEEGTLARVAATETFCEGVIDAVAPYTPCIKIQSACFERYQWPGVEAMGRLVERARTRGLVVIADVKRGDIGISSAHYAEAFLSPWRLDDRLVGVGADAVTINPYLGMDALEPFVRTAAAHARGLFALVRTSNPGSDALQSLPLADGRAVCDAVADLVREAGDSPALMGEAGYSLLGAVVGATKPDDVRRLRNRMPRQIFLVPGFGAQGGGAGDVVDCFGDDGTGALITASRSVLYAFEGLGTADWQGAVAQSAATMAAEVGAVVPR